MDYAELARRFQGEPAPEQNEQQEQDFVKSDEFANLAARFGGQPVQSQEEKLAARFGQTDFGESDIKFSERMRVSTGDTFEEKRNIFLRIHPEGDFRQIEETGEFVFRRDPSESYKKFNPEGFEKTDIAYLAGAGGAPLLGEIAAFGSSLATSPAPQVGGARYVLSNIGRGIFGAFVGEQTKQATQTATGVQEDPAGRAFLGRPAEEGLYSLAGGVAGEGVSRTLDAVSGAGLFSLKPGAAEAMQAAERLGVDQPLPGQTVRANVIARIQGQAGQTTPIIQESLDRANRQLTQQLEDLSLLSGTERKFAVNNIKDAFDTAKRDITLDLSSRTNLSNEDFGIYLQGVRSNYAKVSQEKVTEAYNVARSFDEPLFDPTALQGVADDVSKQTTVRTVRPGEPQAPSIVDEFGRPIGQPTQTQVTRVEPIPDQLGQVRKIADQIKRADPESISVEQLVAWERSLFDLSQPDVPGGPIKEAQKKAIDLRRSIKDTLDNPTNIGGEFGDAWRSAREAAAIRFNTLEDTFVAQIARTDRPASIANKLFDPNQVDPSDVRIIRRMVDSDKFENIQAAFADRILQDPDKISSVLQAYDPDVLSLMLSPEQLNSFKSAGRIIDDINLTDISKAAARQEEFQPFIRELTTGQGATARTNALFRFVLKNGGKDGSLGRIVRTGLVDEIINTTVQKASARRGGDRIKVEAFNEALEEFSERGLTRFFQPREIDILRDVVSVADFTAAEGEGVAALLGATAAQQATELKWQGFSTLARNLGVGNLLVSDAGKSLIQGVGKAPTRRDLIIPFATTTARVLKEDEELGADEDLPTLDELLSFIQSEEEE